MECPVCKETMSGLGNHYYCRQCKAGYKVRFLCEKCGNQPEEISSCGAVSYFCNTCNELKSRQQMKKRIYNALKEKL